MNRRRSDRFPFSSRLEVRRGARRDPAPMRASELLEVRAFDVSVDGFGFSVAPRHGAQAPLSIGDAIAVSMPDLNDPFDEPHLDGVHFEVPAIVRHVTRAPDGAWLIGAERHN